MCWVKKGKEADRDVRLGDACWWQLYLASHVSDNQERAGEGDRHFSKEHHTIVLLQGGPQ